MDFLIIGITQWDLDMLSASNVLPSSLVTDPRQEMITLTSIVELDLPKAVKSDEGWIFMVSIGFYIVW